MIKRTDRLLTAGAVITYVIAAIMMCVVAAFIINDTKEFIGHGIDPAVYSYLITALIVPALHVFAGVIMIALCIAAVGTVLILAVLCAVNVILKTRKSQELITTLSLVFDVIVVLPFAVIIFVTVWSISDGQSLRTIIFFAVICVTAAALTANGITCIYRLTTKKQTA